MGIQNESLGRGTSRQARKRVAGAYGLAMKSRDARRPRLVERKYPAGTAFVDPGHGHVHAARNATGGVTVFVA
jgi:hypothetical protein